MNHYHSTSTGAAIAMFLVVVLLGALGIWLAAFAPCKYVTWMPTKEVPTRCLQVDVR